MQMINNKEMMKMIYWLKKIIKNGGKIKKILDWN